jgi:hypothetical protein
LLKEILNNNKPLEKNSKLILAWLKNKRIHPNIRNMINIENILTNYSIFMNDAKHSRTGVYFSKEEIEFAIYQTGIFIRLILEADKKEIP